ncbi:MAG: DNRLRE domain-containing protein, partial [Pontiellaceae bacterium]|nr:DNRLRE domain-containing protein [Pontiellaceae bacterium]
GSLLSNGTGTAGLRIGDTSAKQQMKSIVSFNTASLPDSCTVLSATLKLKRGTAYGATTNFGGIRVDIRGGSGFNNSATLQIKDFQAAADAANVAALSYPATSNNWWSTGSLSATGLTKINRTGKTQLRVYFATDDDNDGTGDYLGFYAGDNATATNRPVLEISYQ